MATNADYDLGERNSELLEAGLLNSVNILHNALVTGFSQGDLNLHPDVKLFSVGTGLCVAMETIDLALHHSHLQERS